MTLLDARLRTTGKRIRFRGAVAWNGPATVLMGLIAAIVAGWVLTALPPLEGAALVLLVATVVGTLIEPFVGLGAALFVGPLKGYLSAEVPTIPAQVGHVFVVLALGSWLMRLLAERDIRISRVRSPLFLPLMGFLGAALLSMWDGVGVASHGLHELVKWVEILILFVFVKEHLGTGAGLARGLLHSDRAPGSLTQRARALIVMLLGSGLLQAAIGIWQFRLRGEGPEHFQILGGDLFRAYGTFEQPNPYAGYVGLTAALGVGVVAALAWEQLEKGGYRVTQQSHALKHKSTSRQTCTPSVGWPLCLFSTVASLTMIPALVVSWSRGGWLGFGAAVLVMASALPRKAARGLLLVAVLISAGIGLHISGRLPASVTARLTTFVKDVRLEDVRGVAINDANYAVIERLAHWQTALDMFRHRLWTGVGFGCYEAAYHAFALINWPMALGHAHNIYLNLAAEVGLIGLTFYVLLWGVLFWQAWAVTRRAEGLTRGIGIGLLGAWTHLSVHHLLDNLYVNNVHLHIAVLLGLAAFVFQRTNRGAFAYDQ